MGPLGILRRYLGKSDLTDLERFSRFKEVLGMAQAIPVYTQTDIKMEDDCDFN
jgi:hypothetical protein